MNRRRIPLAPSEGWLTVILVLILIFWPQSVTYWIDQGKAGRGGTTIEMPPPPPPPDLGPLR